MAGNEIIFANLDLTSQIFGDTLLAILRSMGVYSQTEIEAIVDSEDLVDKTLLEMAAKELGPPPQQPPPVNAAALEYVASKNPDAAATVKVLYEKKMAEYQQQAQQYEQLVRDRAKQILMEQIKDLKVGRYSTKVSQSPHSPTRRYSDFMQLIELDKAKGGQIPLKTLLEASDITNKDRIIEQVEQQSQVVGAA